MMAVIIRQFEEVIMRCFEAQRERPRNGRTNDDFDDCAASHCLLQGSGVRRLLLQLQQGFAAGGMGLRVNLRRKNYERPRSHLGHQRSSSDVSAMSAFLLIPTTSRTSHDIGDVPGPDLDGSAAKQKAPPLPPSRVSDSNFRQEPKLNRSVY
jgi:hypothetical protein